MKIHFYHEDILSICDNNHLTVDEIFSKLKKKHPSVGLSTVYRNVEELVRNGKLKKITNLGSKALFEKTKQFHIHIFDEKNNQVYDMDLKDCNIPLPDNFKLKDMEITIKGEFIK